MNISKKNVCCVLRNREYGEKNYYRSNLLILKDLITEETNDFTDFWRNESRHCLIVESFHVLENNMRKCYTTNTYSTPFGLYNIDKQISRYGPIREYITSRGPVENTNGESQLSVYAVTRKNYLLHLNIATGKIVHALLLSTEYSFIKIDWDVTEERFYVSSTKTKNQTSPFMALQIFSVWPLRYNGLFEIHPKMFGDKMSDVMLSDYMLTVSYTNNFVRFFKFPSPSTCFSETPFLHNVASALLKSMEELSLKINLASSPEMLLEVPAPHSILSIGGMPWHYIITEKSCQHLWEIKSLETNIKCHKGFIGSHEAQLDPDQLFFHPHDSEKIVLLEKNLVTVYKIDSDDIRASSAYKLKELYTITAKEMDTSSKLIRYTSSGREIKPTIKDTSLSSSYNLMQCLSFEDELDFIVVTTIFQDVSSSNWHGIVHIHNNRDGKLLRSYKMSEIWDLDAIHGVEMDLDTIYHFTKDKGKYVLYIHRLKIDVFS